MGSFIKSMHLTFFLLIAPAMTPTTEGELSGTLASVLALARALVSVQALVPEAEIVLLSVKIPCSNAFSASVRKVTSIISVLFG
jgi:hypothetical protein